MTRTPPPKQSRQLPVFVYGTLRHGQKNYLRYLRGRTREEHPATTCGELYYIADGGYPYLQPGKESVVGELMVLEPDRYEGTLRELDLLEEYDARDEGHSVYLRRETMVTLGDGRRVSAWVYFWNCPELVGERITSGDFARRSEG